MLLRALRKNMKIIAVVVAIAFIAGGTLIYLTTGSSTKAPRVKASNQPVAVINGEEISRSEYRTQLNSQLQQMRGKVGPEQVLSLKSRVLESVINQKLMKQKAKAKGLLTEVSDKKLEAKLQEVIKRSPASSKQELKTMLKKSGRTIADYKQRIKEFLALQKLHNQVTKGVKVTEQEIKQEYEEVSPSHILIKTKNKSTAEAKQKAKEILQKIKSGKDFAKMARKYSEGPSAKKGGKLGSIGHNSRMAPAFEKKAFSLSVGEVSKPIKTQFGYHIIKVTDKKVAEGKQFRQKKDKLKQNLLTKKKRKKFRSWLNQTRKKTKIKIKDQEIKAYKAAQNGNYKKAIANYKEVLNSSAQTSYLYHNLADAYRQQDKKEKAIATYKEAINKNPKQVTFYTKLANLYRSKEKTKQAVDVYERALKKNKDNAQLHFNLGNLYRQMKKKEKAIAQYEKFSKLSGDNLMAHYRLYTIYKRMGLSERANKERKKVREIQKKRQKKAKQQKSQQQKSQ